MKWFRLITPLISLALLISIAAPVFAEDPADSNDIDVKVGVVSIGGNVDMGINVQAESSTVTVNQSNGAATTVNGYADSTTNVNTGPVTNVTVNQTDQSATVEGSTASTLNVNGGTNTSITVNQNNQSVTSILGGAHPSIQVNGSDGSITKVHIAQPMSLSIKRDFNATMRTMNTVVMPKLEDLTQNTNIITNAMLKMINEGQLNTTEIKVLKESLMAVKDDSADIHQQIETLKKDISAMDSQIDSEIKMVKNFNDQQSKIIDNLAAKLGEIESKQFAMEHSGFEYQVKTFFSSLSNRITASAASLADNLKRVVLMPVRIYR